MSAVSARDYMVGPNGAVVPFSGEFTDGASEISGIGRGGVAFSLERRYSSFSNYDCGFGVGWNFNYNAGIIVEGKDFDSAQQLTLFIGSRDIRFEKRDSCWQPEPGMFLRLVREGERIMLYTPDLLRYEFEPAAEQVSGIQRWRIAAVASRHGKYRANRLEVAYLLECDRIAHITDPLGQKFFFAYDAAGHIVQVANDREFINFDYDDTGKLLVRVRYMPLKLSLTKDFTPEISYQYTVGNGPLLRQKSSNALKYVTVVEYDVKRRVQKTGFVAKDQQQMWEFEYLPNNVTIVKSPQPTPDSRYSFAGAPHPSLPVSIEIPAQQAKWQYDFNADFMLTSITDPLGKRTVRTYDSSNINVLMHGNMLEEKQLPAPGLPADLKCYGHRIGYHKQIALPVGVDYYQVGNDGKETTLKRERFEYSDGEFLLTCHNDGGIKQYTAYNRFGLPVLEWDANQNVTISYYAEKLPRRYSFNFVDGDVKNGGPLVRTVQDADDAEIEVACKAIGHKKISRNKRNRIPSRALESRVAYDPYGNKTHIKSGFEESFSIFATNGKILVSCAAGTGLAEYQYFPSGRTDRIYHEFCPAEKQQYRGNIWSHFSNSRYYAEKFKYDSLDMLVEHQLTDEPFDKDAPIFRYARYPNGKVKMITNPTGVSRVDEYDPKTGRLRKQLLLGGDQSITLTSNYEYYPDGQIKNYVDQFGGLNSFGLDGFGRVSATTDSKMVTVRQRRDGLDRVIEKTVSCDGKKLNGQRFIYSSKNQKLESEFSWWSTENKVLETAKYLYDEAGYLIAKRGVHKDGWHYLLIDGCGDTVAELSPEGEASVKVLHFGKPVYTASFLGGEKKNEPVLIGSLTEYDFAGRATRITPVDSNNTPVATRSEICEYNMTGQLIKATMTALTTSTVEYNTLGKTIRETTTPLSSTFGEAPLETTYQYRADGQLACKEFGNRALALRGQKENVKPELVDAPQITVFEYDVFGRMVRTTNPDGLITSKTYNEHSLPITIKWTHIAEPDKTLRHLRLKYTISGEVTSITDGNTNKLLRKYKYDKLGNCVLAVDHSNPHPVSLERQFDSLGNMTMEKVGYGGLKFPWSTFGYEPTLGKRSANWEGIASSGEYWHKETRVVDKAGRIVGISLDDKSERFVEWSYIGNKCEKREVSDSRISQRTEFTSLMEPQKTVLAERRGNIIGGFEYDYGPQGQPVYAATSLRDKYNFAVYSQFDVYRRLVGQNGEAVVPAGLKEAKRRRCEVFDDEKTSIVAVNTSRMIYDQANNIWGRYSGTQLPNVTPHDLKEERESRFSSPATVIAGDSGLPDLALRELASNREAATASYAGDSNLKATEFKYDRLGNLVEFEGTFWNGNRRYPVKWDLTFDPLGRLSEMKATALEDMGVVKKDAKVAELSFAYDAENRRLFKQVTDRTRIGDTIVRSEVTMFRGNQQTLVFDLKENNTLELSGEYLWGTTERELVMAALPEYQAEKLGEYKIRRYFFQQDKGLNIVFISKVDDNGRIIPVAAESYLGFGDNSTFAEIADIQSSMCGVNVENAYNRELDEQLGASWKNPGGWQYIELQLGDENKLAQLTVWTDSFSKDFYIFVLPENAPRDYVSNLKTWLDTPEHIEKFFAAAVINGKFGDRVMGDALTSPCRLPLRELNGNRILLVFDDSRQHDIDVREFEVVKVADNPSPIAFAGQWMDRETGMYYQVNRYRLSGSDKFISPDPIGFMDGNNLYAYAKGNPLEWHDPDGRWGHILVGAGIGAVFGGGGYLLNCWLTGAEFSWAEFGIQTTIGALSGAVGAATFGVGSFGVHGWQGAVLAGVTSGGAAGATAGGLDAGIHSAMAGNSIGETLSKTAWGAFKGGVTGAIAGGVASGTIQAINVKPVQDVINRGLAIIRLGTGEHITRRAVKGFLNAGLAGFMGGGSAGATSGVFHGIETGDWSTISSRATRGMIQGTAGALVMHTALSSAEHYTKRTWDRDRASYWRQEAKNNPSGYSEADLARMRSGRAPQRINPTTGEIEPMELHHDLIPRRSGLPHVLVNQRWNLRKVWHDEHRAIDVYRN